MKKFIFLFSVFLILIVTLDSGFAQWVRVWNSTSIYKRVWTLARNGDYLFAGTDDGVFTSTNDGINWTSVSILNNRSAQVLIVKDNYIFAGTWDGIFRSSNNGTNWIQVGLSEKNCWALGANNNNIFAGTYQYGVYYSSDNGNNWVQTSLNGNFINAIAVNSDTVYAGAATGIFRTTDNGNNWIHHTFGPIAPVLAVTYSGVNIFAGTDNDGVFLSTDNGLNWTQTSLNNESVLSLTARDIYIFAGVSFYTDKIFMTSNNGLNWILKNQGMPEHISTWSLLINDLYIFAGTDSGIWRRTYSEIIGVQNISSEIPSSFSLHQNYPNPFNSSTKIKFDISHFTGSVVSLSVYDLIGREIAILVNESLSVGEYEVTFDGSGLPSGVYLYKLSAGDYTNTKRMLVIK